MSQPKLQYTSLLRGPILLAHFFATAFAVGYSVAGVRMSIFRIFAHGASPHRTCDAIMLGVMWYGGFTALAASGLTVVLVIVRCCLMSAWARAAAGPGGAGVTRLKSIRSRYASARPAALVSLCLAPLAMLESLEEFRNGDGNDDTSSAAAPRAPGGAAAPQDRYRCSSPGDDVECAAALLLRRSPTASGNAGDENSSDLKTAAAGAASIAAGDGGCYSVGYVPLPGAPHPHLTPPPAASALSTAASSTSPAPAAAAIAAAVASTPTAPSSNAFLPPTPSSAMPPAPAAAPQPPPTTTSSHHHHQQQQLLGTPGHHGPPSSSSTSSSTCCSTLSSRPGRRRWGATWRLLRCFAAEAGLVLAPVWLHLFVVGSALGVLALLGARVMTDPFY